MRLACPERVCSVGVVVALVLLAACHDPAPLDGLMCSQSGKCPAGQVCHEGICYRVGTMPDASGGPDADPNCPAQECTLRPLAGGEDSIQALDASDPDYLFWTAEGSDRVLRTAKADGATEVFYEGPADCRPFGLALDDTYVYWTESNDAGRVMRKARVGGTAEPLVTDQLSPRHLAVDDTNLYWTNGGAGSVVSMPKEGGEVAEIASDQLGPLSILLDDTWIYWTNVDGDRVMRRDKTRMLPAQQLAGDQDGARALAHDGTHLYWTTQSGNTVMRKLLEDGTTTTLASDQDGAWAITVDDQFVYWTNYFSDEVLRIPSAGGSPTIVASGQDGPAAIAIDGYDLYWLNNLDQNNRVMHTVPCACP